MTAYLSPIGNSQFEDSNGNPLTGGKVYTYLAGTSTPAGTWTTSVGNVAQANPIVLNSLGATANPIWLTAGVAYKFVIKDSTDVTTLYTFDNITGINDPAYSLLSEWVLYATNTPTYVATTIFSVQTDQTTIFQPGRRVKTINSGGTVYSTIQTSAFSAGVTTVTVLNDSGVLDVGLSAVYYGFLSATSPSIPSTSAGIAQTPFRNLVFNGDFRINQRYSVALQTLSASNILYWGPDMFYAIVSGASSGCRTLPETDGTYRFNLFGAASVSSFKVGTRIEARNSLHLAGSTATLSFKSSLSIPSNVTWTVYYANSDNAFGAEGSYTRTQIATGTFAVTATEQTYSTSLNIPSAAKTGIEIVLNCGALGAGQTWKLGQVQFEKGTISASNIGFEVVDATLQTARCQRYQLAINEFIGQTYNVTNVYSPKIVFPVEMRVAPAFDGTPAAPAFAVSTGAAGTPALFTDAAVITSNKSVLCYNSATNWSVGANVRLTAMIACNIP